LAETQLKLESFRNKIGQEADLRRKIESLEKALEEHDKQKRQMLSEFEQFKATTAKQEADLISDHNHKVVALTKEIQMCQTEFEDRLGAFENLISAFNKEKSDALSDLRKSHQIEIENLLKAQRSHTNDVSAELETLKAQYAEELAKSNALCEQIRGEKERMEADYEEKLSKQRALYERELEVLQSKQVNNITEQQKLLQEKLEKLTRDFQFQEAQYRQRIDGLLNQLSTNEETISSLKAEISNLNFKHSNTSEEVSALHYQVNLSSFDVLKNDLLSEILCVCVCARARARVRVSFRFVHGRILWLSNMNVAKIPLHSVQKLLALQS